MRTRFAPSPTGHLHIGHARAAREAFGFASKHNGQCLLRIEDTDHTRCNTAYTSAIYADLDWLGFDWPLPVRVQSQHYPDYAQVVLTLLDRGLAYPCTLTRSEIKAGQTPSAHNPREINDIVKIMNTVSEAAYHETPKIPFAIRLDLQKAIENVADDTLNFEETGPLHAGTHNIRPALSSKEDPIIARKDIGCSYIIACTHDDALQGITHIVRGADIFEETPVQILLQTLMGWPRPIYYHHELVLNDMGAKLSKRNLDTTLQSLREAGQTPEDIWNMVT